MTITTDALVQLKQDIAWTAQTVHQTYHTDMEEPVWHECDKAVCRQFRDVLINRVNGMIAQNGEETGGPVFEPVRPVYLTMFMNDMGGITQYISSLNEQKAIDSAAAINGIVCVVPILHDFTQRTSE
jgi:hypothetical protein